MDEKNYEGKPRTRKAEAVEVKPTDGKVAMIKSGVTRRINKDDVSAREAEGWKLV
jgi:hypothetical protein